MEAADYHSPSKTIPRRSRLERALGGFDSRLSPTFSQYFKDIQDGERTSSGSS